jgi:hypothetical protein
VRVEQRQRLALQAIHLRHIGLGPEQQRVVHHDRDGRQRQLELHRTAEVPAVAVDGHGRVVARIRVRQRFSQRRAWQPHDGHERDEPDPDPGEARLQRRWHGEQRDRRQRARDHVQLHRWQPDQGHTAAERKRWNHRRGVDDHLRPTEPRQHGDRRQGTGAHLHVRRPRPGQEGHLLGRDVRQHDLRRERQQRDPHRRHADRLGYHDVRRGRAQPGDLPVGTASHHVRIRPDRESHIPERLGRDGRVRLRRDEQADEPHRAGGGHDDSADDIRLRRSR